MKKFLLDLFSRIYFNFWVVKLLYKVKSKRIKFIQLSAHGTLDIDTD